MVKPVKRKPGRPKSAKAKTTEESASASSEQQLSQEDVAKKILMILQECQMTSRSHAKLLDEMKQLYYSDKTVASPNKTSSSPSVHEMLCAGSIWKYMLPFLNAERGERTDNALKFIAQVVKNVGLENGTKDKKPTPLYFIFTKFIIKAHEDIRPLVRQRLVEIAYIILQSFNEVDEFKNLKEKLYTVVRQRAKDKIAPIRLQAIECLFYYEELVEARQVLNFCARKDNNQEVRRKALNILGNFSSIKISVFYEQAFDTNENIRLAAFKSLVKISLNRLTGVHQRGKIITWGLMDPSKNVRAIVKKELLPAWLEYSKNSLASLFGKLELYTKPQIARQILDTFYDDSEDGFEKIDLGFLSPEKLVPLEEISIERIQYWLMLCEKFGNFTSCRQKLLPEALPMCNYLKEIVKLIHEENKQAREERRSEEYSLYLCLTAALRLAKMIELEEGSRREMQSVVQLILSDPLLGDSIITNATLNVAYDIFLNDEFEQLMSNLFDTIFAGGCEGSVVEMETPTSIPKTNCKRGEAENIDPTVGIKNPGKDTPAMANNVNMTPIQNPLKLKPSLRPTHTSTPLRKEDMQAIYNLQSLRNMLAEKRLQKLRAKDARDKLIGDVNLSVNSAMLKQFEILVTRLEQEENELLGKIEAARHADDIGFITEEGTAAPLPTNNAVADRASPPLTPIREDDSDSDSFDMEVTHEQERQDLKGLGMLVRYLSLHRKINDQVCHILENIVLPGLQDDNPRVRAKAMNALCVAAIVDEKRARSTMVLLYKGVVMETDLTAKSAAFSSLLDLLIEYGPDKFRQVFDEFGDELPSNHHDDVPHAAILNDPAATSEQLKEAFTSIVVNFNSEPPCPRAVQIRVAGITKLLLRGRITSEEVLADLLCTWADPTSHRSPISMIGYQINAFLPVYTAIELENSNRVGRALIISLGRIVKELVKKGKSIKDSEFMNLVDFVLPCISPSVTEKFQNHHVVHEKLAVAILEDIDKEIDKMGNAQLARILHQLTFTSEEGINSIRNACTKVYQTLVDTLTENGSPWLKSAINQTLRRLETDLNLSSEESGGEVDE